MQHQSPDVDTLHVDVNLPLSSQAKNYLDIGKVTGDGLIKGHAYAITDSDKARITKLSFTSDRN